MTANEASFSVQVSDARDDGPDGMVLVGHLMGCYTEFWHRINPGSFIVNRRRLLSILMIAGSVHLSSVASGWAQQADTPALDPASRKAAGQFLQKLLNAVTGKPQPQSADKTGTLEDPVDERAIIDRQQRSHLERAQRMLEAGDHAEGLRLLQHLLNSDADSLLREDDGQWRSLHGAVEETILQAAPEIREAYRQQYAITAADWLSQARKAGDIRALAVVTRRYLATPTGEAAADEIATLMLDAGHPEEAAYWHQRLINAGSRITEDPTWKRKAALVRQLAGRATNLELNEWRQPFGGPKHTGRLSESQPVLIPRWSQPTTERPQIVEQITKLTEDLADGGRACIPAAMPLAVDGLILFRTLRGMSVVDAASGQSLWDLPEEVSVERLLAGETVSRPASESGPSRLRPMQDYQGLGADEHALTNLLFRNGVYGLVSSDGERVFALEDHATLSYRQPGYYRGQPSDDDPHGRDWESNRVAAYDLHSGRRLWSVGGPAGKEPFQQQLAGTLFHGPPVVDGDELFLIGEQRGAEVLFVLDRRSGRTLWSHVLSGVTAEIQYDLVRRWWPALPAVGEGIIVCPTTVGWMVAIDRYERCIRWAHRLTPRRTDQRHSRQSVVATPVPLNSRWCPSAPVLAGDRVVFTPTEFPDPEYHTNPYVVGLDRQTGEAVWQHEKETGLYLAGVADKAVLLVGSDQMEARDLSDGRRHWRVTLPKGTGPPSGRGVVTGTNYLLPLQSGELWRIDLSDGSVLGKSKLHDEHASLGNLLVYRKRLVSLTPLGVTCFEDREEVEALLANTRDGSLNADDRLRAAELQMIDGHNRSAVELLRDIDPASLAGAARARSLRRQSLTALIRNDPTSTAANLSELESLAQTEQHLLSVRHLQAERLLAAGDRSEAYLVYWKLARSPSRMLVEEGETHVRLDRWLAARLGSVWALMTPGEQAVVDQQIESTIDALIQNLAFTRDESATAEWWSQILSFHPQGRRLELHLAEQAIASGRLAEAEVRLLRLLNDGTPPSQRNAALLRLVELLDEQSRSEDATWYFARFENLVTPGDPAVGPKLEAWVNKHRNEGSGATPTAPIQDWTSEEFSLSRTNSAFNRQVTLASLAVIDSVPSVDQLLFRVQPQLQRLSVDSLAGKRLWESPLRSLTPNYYDQNTTAGSLGQILLLVHQGVLHALSLTDRELLWQKPLDVRSDVPSYARGSSLTPPRELETPSIFRRRNGLGQLQTQAGLLAVWRSGYLCYLGRNTLTVADPLTGETLWMRQGIPPQTLVDGSDRHLFIVPPGSSSPFALRIEDGSPAELPHFKSSLTAAIGVHATGLVTLEDSGSGLLGLGKHTIRLNLLDLQTGQSVWQASFPEDTRFARLGREELFVLEPEGTARLVNWAERQDRALGRIDVDDIRQARSIFAIADRQRVYLSLSGPSETSYWTDTLVSVPVNGPLVSLDRRGGGVVWRQTIENQNLLIEHFEQLPVLVMHMRQSGSAQPAINAQQIQMVMLDKRTGQQLLQASRYVSPGSIRSVEFDLPARVIEFRTFRERLRIQPAAPDATPE